MAWPLDERIVQHAVSNILEHSERQPDLNQLYATFVDPGILIHLNNNNNQIVGSGTNPSGFQRPFLVSVPPSAASFVRTDTTTKGNWSGTYGSDGYVVFDDVSHLPSYARLSSSGATPFIWQQPSTDARASGRVAECRAWPRT